MHMHMHVHMHIHMHRFCKASLLEIIFTAVNVDDDRVRERLGAVRTSTPNT